MTPKSEGALKYRKVFQRLNKVLKDIKISPETNKFVHAQNITAKYGPMLPLYIFRYP